MIVCYHKARKKFYVIKSNKKADRKFLFSSKDFSECADFAGGLYTISRSAAIALDIDDGHPTPSDASSDAGRETPATTIATPDARRRIEKDPDT